MAADPSWEFVMHQQCRGRCVANPAHAATIVHEIEPRSRRPYDWWKPDNRVALCRQCHNQIHHEGTRLWAERLRTHKRLLLDILGTDMLIWSEEESNHVT